MTSQTVTPQNIQIVYRYKDGLYLNFTNRCPTACRFCIKFTWKMMYRSYNLKLHGEEPSVPQVLEEIRRAYSERPFKEIVFCGYGESTYRLADMIQVGDAVKEQYPQVFRRLNTIGLGNLIHSRSIPPEMAAHLDAVSISLNTADPRQWLEIHNPLPEFQEKGFESVIEFIGQSVRAIPNTVATAVEQPGIDIGACRRLVLSLGAQFRLRSLLDDYEPN
jgi:TatD family-associated radical SAM protein